LHNATPFIVLAFSPRELMNRAWNRSRAGPKPTACCSTDLPSDEQSLGCAPSNIAYEEYIGAMTCWTESLHVGSMDKLAKGAHFHEGIGDLHFLYPLVGFHARSSIASSGCLCISLILISFHSHSTNCKAATFNQVSSLASTTAGYEERCSQSRAVRPTLHPQQQSVYLTQQFIREYNRIRHSTSVSGMAGCESCLSIYFI
jgi:hypothetical protein